RRRSIPGPGDLPVGLGGHHEEVRDSGAGDPALGPGDHVLVRPYHVLVALPHRPGPDRLGVGAGVGLREAGGAPELSSGPDLEPQVEEPAPQFKPLLPGRATKWHSCHLSVLWQCSLPAGGFLLFRPPTAAGSVPPSPPLTKRAGIGIIHAWRLLRDRRKQGAMRLESRAEGAVPMATTGIAVEAHRTQVLLLRALYFGPRSFWQLLRAGKAQAHQVLQALQSLLDNQLAAYDGSRFVITPAGRQKVEALGLDRVADPQCETCGGRGHVLRPPFDRVLAEFQEIVAMRPKATTDFDQGYVTPETSVLRLALMAQHGDLVGKDLLLLGDDDLTGIAAALSGLPRRICVLDVDERIVQFVRDVARDRGWQNVQAEVYDVREELPAHLRGQFDTFFTDPVETLKGIFLFLSRCTQALRGPGAAGYFGLSYLEASWQKWRQVQQGLLEMGYAITE